MTVFFDKPHYKLVMVTEEVETLKINVTTLDDTLNNVFSDILDYIKWINDTRSDIKIDSIFITRHT